MEHCGQIYCRWCEQSRCDSDHHEYSPSGKPSFLVGRLRRAKGGHLQGFEDLPIGMPRCNGTSSCQWASSDWDFSHFSFALIEGHGRSYRSSYTSTKLITLASLAKKIKRRQRLERSRATPGIVANVRRLRRAAKTRNARNAEVLKTVVDELLVHEHAGRAAEVRAIDDDLLLGIERIQGIFQALEMDRTGNTFGAEHPVIQTIYQFEVPAAIQLFL